MVPDIEEEAQFGHAWKVFSGDNLWGIFNREGNAQECVCRLGKKIGETRRIRCGITVLGGCCALSFPPYCRFHRGSGMGGRRFALRWSEQAEIYKPKQHQFWCNLIEIFLGEMQGYTELNRPISCGSTPAILERVWKDTHL